MSRSDSRLVLSSSIITFEIRIKNFSETLYNLKIASFLVKIIRKNCQGKVHQKYFVVLKILLSENDG